MTMNAQVTGYLNVKQQQGETKFHNKDSNIGQNSNVRVNKNMITKCEIKVNLCTANACYKCLKYKDPKMMRINLVCNAILPFVDIFRPNFR